MGSGIVMLKQWKINLYKIQLSIMSQYSNPGDSISIRQIPKFQFQLHNEQLVNCIKQLTFNMKTQQKNIQKIKKDLEMRPTQAQITEALVFVNSLIEIDPNLTKQLKSKQNKKQDLANNPINHSSSELGKKINQMSQAVTLLNNLIKNLDKKVTDIEFNTKSALNEKSNALQEQIDSNYSKSSHQFLQLKQKIEITTATFSDKVREVQTKTVWQINDCKMRLNSCINDQFVKDSMRQLEGKMTTKMKEQLIRQGTIDPERIAKIEQNILKNQKQFASQLTETSYKIQTIKQHIQKSIMSKKEFGDERIQIQKRFGLLNTNLSDAVRRVRQCEAEIGEEKDKIKKLQSFSQSMIKETNRMNSVLNNLKIGDDFQKMLQKMDPHKICELDDRINFLTLNQEKLAKSLDISRTEIDRLRSKTQFCNILTPNTGGPGTKFNKQEIEQIVHEYFTANLFAKKLQNLESQFLEVKSFPEMINSINKTIARIQKETDNHNLIYQLRGLQEYVKKQILIVNNRINSLELIINENKKVRPQSAGRNDNKLGSSVSFKKLTPVNCISCYPSNNTGGLNFDKKNLIRKL